VEGLTTLALTRVSPALLFEWNWAEASGAPSVTISPARSKNLIITMSVSFPCRSPPAMAAFSPRAW